MTLSLLLGALTLPAWPVEAALSLAVSACFAAFALRGLETPPPAAVATEAVFASHGWV